MLRFAANLTMMFTDVDFPDRFRRAASAGFAGVEMLFPYDHPPREVGNWLRETDLECALFNLPPGDFGSGERGIAALPGREDEFRRSIDIAIEYAHAMNVPRLHAMAGLKSAGANFRTYETNLRTATELCAAEGIELLIEPINSRDMPGYLLNDHRDAVRIIEEIAAPNLRLQCDLYHLQITSGDLSRTIESEFAKIGHIQIAGVPDRHEPDTGEIAYGYIFSLLEKLSYQGWIGCEYRPRELTESGLGWLPR